MSIQIFLSYSHDDARWFERGELSLIPIMERALKQVKAELWYDKNRIHGADDWNKEILDAINRADIAVLLVSLPYIVSPFIREKNLPRIEERKGNEGLLVLPVLVGDCEWKNVSLFDTCQMLPGDPTPLIRFEKDIAGFELCRKQIVSEVTRLVEKVKERNEAKEKEEVNVRIDDFRQELGLARGDVENRVAQEFAGQSIKELGLSHLREFSDSLERQVLEKRNRERAEKNSVSGEQESSSKQENEAQPPEIDSEPLKMVQLPEPDIKVKRGPVSLLKRYMRPFSYMAIALTLVAVIYIYQKIYTPTNQNTVTFPEAKQTQLVNEENTEPPIAIPSEDKGPASEPPSMVEQTPALTPEQPSPEKEGTLETPETSSTIDTANATAASPPNTSTAPGPVEPPLTPIPAPEKPEVSQTSATKVEVKADEPETKEVESEDTSLKDKETIPEKVPQVIIKPESLSEPSFEPDAEADEIVRIMLDEVKMKEVTGWGSYSVIEVNSNMVSKALYEKLKGKEVPALCRLFIEGQRQDWREPWKILSLLGYALKTKEGKEYTNDAVQTILRYGVLEMRGSFIRPESLKVIENSTPIPKAKWAYYYNAIAIASPGAVYFMLPKLVEHANATRDKIAIESTRQVSLDQLLLVRDASTSECPSDVVSVVLNNLVKITSPESRKETGNALLNLLPQFKKEVVNSFVSALSQLTSKEDQSEMGARFLDLLEIPQSDTTIAEITKILKEWKTVDHISRVKEILPNIYNDTQKNQLIGLLAEWGDTGTAESVRQKIEEVRYGNDYSRINEYTGYLYKLSGSASLEYILDVFRLATPQTRKSLIEGTLRNVREQQEVTPVIRSMMELDRMPDSPDWQESTLPTEADSKVDEMVNSCINEISITGEQFNASYQCPTVVKDSNSGLVWRKLYDVTKGREIPSLCRLLQQPHTDWETPWKILSLLKISIRPAEALPWTSEAVRIVAKTSLGTQYLIQRAGLEIINEARVPRQLKMQVLLDVLPGASNTLIDPVIQAITTLYLAEDRDKVRQTLLNILPQIVDTSCSTMMNLLIQSTPSDKRDETRDALLQALSTCTKCADCIMPKIAELTQIDKRGEVAAVFLKHLENNNNASEVDTIATIMKSWNIKDHFPEFRKMVTFASEPVQDKLLKALAEGGDKESISLIKEIIENTRYGRSTYRMDAMVANLYLLEGKDCVVYLVDVLNGESPSGQTTLLTNSFKKIQDPTVVNAVKELSESSMDANVRQNAKTYIINIQ